MKKRFGFLPLLLVIVQLLSIFSVAAMADYGEETEVMVGSVRLKDGVYYIYEGGMLQEVYPDGWEPERYIRYVSSSDSPYTAGTVYLKNFSITVYDENDAVLYLPLDVTLNLSGNSELVNEGGRTIDQGEGIPPIRVSNGVNATTDRNLFITGEGSLSVRTLTGDNCRGNAFVAGRISLMSSDLSISGYSAEGAFNREPVCDDGLEMRFLGGQDPYSTWEVSSGESAAYPSVSVSVSRSGPSQEELEAIARAQAEEEARRIAEAEEAARIAAEEEARRIAEAEEAARIAAEEEARRIAEAEEAARIAAEEEARRIAEAEEAARIAAEEEARRIAEAEEAARIAAEEEARRIAEAEEAARIAAEEEARRIAEAEEAARQAEELRLQEEARLAAEEAARIAAEEEAARQRAAEEEAARQAEELRLKEEARLAEAQGAAAVQAETLTLYSNQEEMRTAAETEPAVSLGSNALQSGVYYANVDGMLQPTDQRESYITYNAEENTLYLKDFTWYASEMGTGSTYAALYLPKETTISLSGSNTLYNLGYYMDGSGQVISNGIFAGDNTLTITGEGSLSSFGVESYQGYGISAGRVVIDGKGLAVSALGGTAAFRNAPGFEDGAVVRAGESEAASAETGADGQNFTANKFASVVISAGPSQEELDALAKAQAEEAERIAAEEAAKKAAEEAEKQAAEEAAKKAAEEEAARKAAEEAEKQAAEEAARKAAEEEAARKAAEEAEKQAAEEAARKAAEEEAARQAAEEARKAAEEEAARIAEEAKRQEELRLAEEARKAEEEAAKKAAEEEAARAAAEQAALKAEEEAKAKAEAEEAQAKAEAIAEAEAADKPQLVQEMPQEMKEEIQAVEKAESSDQNNQEEILVQSFVTMVDPGTLTGQTLSGSSTSVEPSKAVFEADGENTGILKNLENDSKYQVGKEENGEYYWPEKWKEFSGEAVRVNDLTADSVIRVRRTVDGVDSEDKIFRIDQQADIPDGYLSTKPATAAGNDGQIIITYMGEYSYQLRESGSETITDVTQNPITGLKGGTVYEIRVKASGTSLASKWQKVTVSAVQPTVLPTPQAVFHATGAQSGTLTNVTSSMVYRLANSTNWIGISGDTAVIASGVAGQIFVKELGKAAENTTDSAEQVIQISQYSAPDKANLVVNNGTVTVQYGTQTQYKLHAADESQYQDVSNRMIKNLSQGDYDIRFKADGSILASLPTMITIMNVPVKSISMSPTELKLNSTDSSAKLTVTFDPLNASDQTVNWYSTNENVVKVQNSYRVSEGVAGASVIAVGQGTATIYAISNGKQATCTVSVQANYYFTYHKNGSWYYDVGGSYTVQATGPASRLAAVKLNGQTINPYYYTVATASDGSTIVTISETAMRAMEHRAYQSLQFVYSDGGTATCFLHILSVRDKPITGDDSHIGLWFSLMLMSAATGGALLSRRKEWE